MKSLNEKLRPILVHATETLLAVGFVLVFFLAFMAILGASFPHGASLGDLLQDPQGDSLTRDARFALNFGQQPSERGAEYFVAQLTDVSRKVKQRPSGAISWTGASSGTQLADHHAVQTFDRSRATIAFDSENQLRLSENSLVIVRSLETEPDRGLRRASLVILGGELTGKIGDSAEGPMTVELVTGEAITEIRSLDGAATRFRIASSTGGSSTLDIYSGGARITAEGVTVDVPAAHSITIRAGEPPSVPLPLPAAPLPESPVDSELLAYAKVRPDVRFSWNATGDEDHWQMEVARDPDFQEIIHERMLDSPELIHGNLPDGKLFWRVRAAKGPARGPFSQVRELTIVNDSQPPSLAVETTRDPADPSYVVVRGRTDPGAELYIAKRMVQVDASGAFEVKLELERGINSIVIEAFDAVGNVTYQSEKIKRRG